MGRCTDLAGYSVWAQLSESQGRLDASQQGNYIQVLDATPGVVGEVPLDWQYSLLALFQGPTSLSLPPVPTPQTLPGKNWRIVGEGRGWGGRNLGGSIDWNGMHWTEVLGLRDRRRQCIVSWGFQVRG